MLVEHGRVVAQTSDGREWTFTPSFKNIATLGRPHDIVSIYAGLHGQDAEIEAGHVLSCLYDGCEDIAELVGRYVEVLIRDDADESKRLYRFDREIGVMSDDEMVIIARHLMQHGIIGKAKPTKGDGKFSDSFEAGEYIAVARVHLGLSAEEAEALSMTEFQCLMEMKYPSKDKERDVPSREEYDAAMAHFEAMKTKTG